ncbi:MAG: hypothetical protein J5I98_20755 [Phaeodactylibacter sp.]|nr:hypothetical protein [Phaeodactylibacter sp.]
MSKENSLEQLKIEVERISKRIEEIGHIPDSLRPTEHGKQLQKERSDLIRKEGRLKLKIEEIEKELETEGK